MMAIPEETGDWQLVSAMPVIAEPHCAQADGTDPYEHAKQPIGAWRILNKQGSDRAQHEAQCEHHREVKGTRDDRGPRGPSERMSIHEGLGRCSGDLGEVCASRDARRNAAAPPLAIS